MASYASPAELAKHMGNLAGFAVGGVQEARAFQLLEDATDIINGDLRVPEGEDVLAAATTVTRDGTGGHELILPRHPVSAVDLVVEIDRHGVERILVYRTEYTWSDAGILTRVGRCWPCHDRAVRSTYTGGLAAMPKTLRKICCRLAAAGWPNPGGADTEEIGDRRVRWNTPGMELTTGESRQLDPYRFNL